MLQSTSGTTPSHTTVTVEYTAACSSARSPARNIPDAGAVDTEQEPYKTPLATCHSRNWMQNPKLHCTFRHEKTSPTLFNTQQYLPRCNAMLWSALPLPLCSLQGLCGQPGNAYRQTQGLLIVLDLNRHKTDEIIHTPSPATPCFEPLCRATQQRSSQLHPSVPCLSETNNTSIAVCPLGCCVLLRWNHVPHLLLKPCSTLPSVHFRQQQYGTADPR